MIRSSRHKDIAMTNFIVCGNWDPQKIGKRAMFMNKNFAYFLKLLTYIFLI